MNSPAPLPSRRNLILIFLIFTTVWFGTLEYRKLIKPDEGRYAEIAREMVVSGDWITPRLNGIKYFEKPPLQYWATAAAFRTFGLDEWTARLWGGLTGYLGVLLTWFLAARLWNRRTALYAAAVQGTSLLYLGIGHLNTLDMGLTFFLQLAVTGFVLANHGDPPPDRTRRWMMVTWAALALAMLTKGLVALVLAGGTLAIYSLLNRDAAPWKRLELLRGIPLFLLIAAPWFIAVSVANPEFPHFFFIHEHFERYLTTEHRRDHPFGYFVPILLLGGLPWIGMQLHALFTGWRGESRGRFASGRMLLVWSVLVYGFFSLSHSKLPSYILPMFPSMALLTGRWLEQAGNRTLMRHGAFVAACAAAAVVLLPRITRFADNETTLAMMSAYARWLTVSAALWLGCTLAGLWLLRRGRRDAAVLLLALGGLLCTTGVIQGHEELGRSNSSYALANAVRPLLPPGVPFYSVDMYEQTFPFYLGRTVTLVHYTDEMGFGLEQQPELAIPTKEEFMTRWVHEPDAFAIMTPDTYNALQGQGLPMQVVARDTRRVVVRKPRP